MMQSCELVTLISTLACSIAKGRSPDELSLIGSILSQLGDTLGTIAANEELLADAASGCCPENKE